jgi:hypothetical protein
MDGRQRILLKERRTWLEPSGITYDRREFISHIKRVQ